MAEGLTTVSIDAAGNIATIVSTLPGASWVAPAVDVSKVVHFTIDKGGANERDVRAHLETLFATPVVSGGSSEVCTIKAFLQGDTDGHPEFDTAHVGEPVEVVSFEAGVLTDADDSSGAIVAADPVPSNSTTAFPKCIFQWAFDPKNLASTMNARVVGTTHVQPFVAHNKYGVDLPGSSVVLVDDNGTEYQGSLALAIHTHSEPYLPVGATWTMYEATFDLTGAVDGPAHIKAVIRPKIGTIAQWYDTNVETLINWPLYIDLSGITTAEAWIETKHSIPCNIAGGPLADQSVLVGRNANAARAVCDGDGSPIAAGPIPIAYSGYNPTDNQQYLTGGLSDAEVCDVYRFNIQLGDYSLVESPAEPGVFYVASSTFDPWSLVNLHERRDTGVRTANCTLTDVGEELGRKKLTIVADTDGWNIEYRSGAGYWHFDDGPEAGNRYLIYSTDDREIILDATAWQSGGPMIGDVGRAKIGFWQEGALGSLLPREWALGDQDALGFSTLYFRLGASEDPNSYAANYLTIDVATGQTVTLTGSPAFVSGGPTSGTLGNDADPFPSLDAAYKAAALANGTTEGLTCRFQAGLQTWKCTGPYAGSSSDLRPESQVVVTRKAGLAQEDVKLVLAASSSVGFIRSTTQAEKCMLSHGITFIDADWIDGTGGVNFSYGSTDDPHLSFIDVAVRGLGGFRGYDQIAKNVDYACYGNINATDRQLPFTAGGRAGSFAPWINYALKGGWVGDAIIMGSDDANVLWLNVWLDELEGHVDGNHSDIIQFDGTADNASFINVEATNVRYQGIFNGNEPTNILYANIIMEGLYDYSSSDGVLNCFGLRSSHICLYFATGMGRDGSNPFRINAGTNTTAVAVMCHALAGYQTLPVNVAQEDSASSKTTNGYGEFGVRRVNLDAYGRGSLWRTGYPANLVYPNPATWAPSDRWAPITGSLIPTILARDLNIISDLVQYDIRGNLRAVGDHIGASCKAGGVASTPEISYESFGGGTKAIEVTVGVAAGPWPVFSSGGPVTSFADVDLPAGFSVDIPSGLVSFDSGAGAEQVATDHSVQATGTGGTDTATLNIKVNPAQGEPVVVEYQTVGSDNDGHEYQDGTGPSYDNDNLILTAKSAGLPSEVRCCYVRFTGVSVPVGATIVSANAVPYSGSNRCWIDLYGEAALDSQDLTTRPGIFDRARTAAFVPWLGSIGDLVIDDWNDSPDITSIIEELIALHGGDMDAENVGLMFWGRTDASMGGTFKTADFDPQFACKLRIAYSVPVVVNPPVLSDESAVLTEGEPYPDFGVANTGDPVDTWEDLDNLGSVPGFEWNGDGTYSVDELAIQEATEQVYRVRATNAGGSDIGNLSVTVLPGAPALHVEYQNQPYLFQAGVPGFFDVTIISGTFDACDWKAGGPALPNGVTLQKVAPNLGRISYDGT